MTYQQRFGKGRTALGTVEERQTALDPQKGQGRSQRSAEFEGVDAEGLAFLNQLGHPPTSFAAEVSQGAGRRNCSQMGLWRAASISRAKFTRPR